MLRHRTHTRRVFFTFWPPDVKPTETQSRCAVSNWRETAKEAPQQTLLRTSTGGDAGVEGLSCATPVSAQYVGRAYVGIQMDLFRLLCQGSAQLLAKVRLAICLLSAAVPCAGAAHRCFCAPVIIRSMWSIRKKNKGEHVGVMLCPYHSTDQISH